MAEVGPSTSCVFRAGIPVDDAIRIYDSIGASALEIGLGSVPELERFHLTPAIRNYAKKFGYVSVHAPFRNVKYPDTNTSKIVSKLKYLCENLPVKGIVLHPSSVSDFVAMEKTGLPFLLENMNKNKRGDFRFGTLPEHFEKLRKDYAFGFVFDAEHAYEHDPSMKLGEELLIVMGDRLQHMHISGQDKENKHVLVHKAGNKNEIIKILEKKIAVPKIIEGELSARIKDTLMKEMNFIRSYEQ